MTAIFDKVKQPDDTQEEDSRLRRWLMQREVQLLLVLVVFTLLVRAGGAKGFLGPTHFPIFLSQVAPDMLVVIPMAMLLIGGMFDLSVTGVANLSVVLVGWTFSRLLGQMDDTLLIILVVAIGLTAGLIVGAINGLAVTRLRMNPLMTTLATWWMAQGFATGVAGGESRHNFVGAFRGIARHQPLQGLGEAFPFLQEMRISTLPLPVFYALIVIFLGWLVLNRTRFGWHIFATGSDRQGAALNGVNVNRVTLAGFIATGVAAAMCGIVWASRLTSAPPNTLGGLELRVIAAAVIGGRGAHRRRRQCARFGAGLVLYAHDPKRYHSTGFARILGVFRIGSGSVHRRRL